MPCHGRRTPHSYICKTPTLLLLLKHVQVIQIKWQNWEQGRQSVVGDQEHVLFSVKKSGDNEIIVLSPESRERGNENTKSGRFKLNAISSFTRS